jgi:hypothetical protein
MKVSGKLKSADTLTSLLVTLIKDTYNAASTPKSRRDSRDNSLSNVVSFVIASIGYLQPSEVWMTRIAREISLSMRTQDEWSTAIGALVESSTEFRSAIADGVGLAVTVEIRGRRGHSIGFAIDWLYACYLYNRSEHSVPFSANVLKYSSVQRRLDEQALAQSVSDVVGSTSVPKMVFDLSQTTIDGAADVGLGMWFSAIMPDRRLDWRLVDFSLGALECAARLTQPTTQASTLPYADLFSAISARIVEQPNYEVPSSKVVTAIFQYADIERCKDALLTGELNVACGLAVALMGISELMPLFLNSMEWEKLGISSPVGLVGGLNFRSYIETIAERPDVSEAFRSYTSLWLGGKLHMFRRSPSMRFIPSERVFVER